MQCHLGQLSVGDKATVKGFAEGLDIGDVMDPVQVDPTDRGRGFQRQAMFQGDVFLYRKPFSIVIDKGDGRLLDLLLADMDQRSRPQPDLLGSASKQRGDRINGFILWFHLALLCSV